MRETGESAPKSSRGGASGARRGSGGDDAKCATLLQGGGAAEEARHPTEGRALRAEGPCVFDCKGWWMCASTVVVVD